jgi:hypothetical protein
MQISFESRKVKEKAGVKVPGACKAILYGERARSSLWARDAVKKFNRYSNVAAGLPFRLLSRRISIQTKAKRRNMLYSRAF